MKLEELTKVIGYRFYCPGCKHSHVFFIGNTQGANWTFNGNINNPTFSPSLLNALGNNKCHLFLRDGVIEYQTDCTHEYSGKSIKLSDIEDAE